MIDCEEMFKEHSCLQLTKSYASYGTDLVVEKELLRTFIDYGQDTCSRHKDEERRIICLECRDVVCVRCLIESHQSHLWSDLEETVQRFRKLSVYDEGGISSRMLQFRDRKWKLNVERADFLEEVTASERAIVTTGQNLKDLIDRHTQVLVDELAQLKMRKLVEMETERQEVEKELKILELCYADLALKLPQKNDLHSSNHSGVVSHSEVDPPKQFSDQDISRHRATMIAFQEAEILEQLKANGSNLLGRLKAEFDLLEASKTDCKDWTLIDFPTEFRSTARDEDCHVTAQLMTLLDTEDWNVFGVSAMRNSLYVLLCNSIIVFDAKEPFNRVGEIKAPQFLYPFDMAACPRTLCLYVTDDGYRCLWRVDSDNQVTRWIDGLYEPSTVSVSVQTGLVTILRSGLPCSLEVYEPTGELVRSTQLPEFIVEPQHAVVTSLGETILCYRQCKTRTWGLCRLDCDGQLAVKCELRDTFHHLAATPCHLALDEFDRLFVADWQKKIDLFDSQLNWDRTLVSSRGDGIERPERICFDRHNGLLMVVHAWGKKTFVYRFIAKSIPDNGRKRINRW